MSLFIVQHCKWHRCWGCNVEEAHASGLVLSGTLCISRPWWCNTHHFSFGVSK